MMNRPTFQFLQIRQKAVSVLTIYFKEHCGFPQKNQLQLRGDITMLLFFNSMFRVNVNMLTLKTLPRSSYITKRSGAAMLFSLTGMKSSGEHRNVESKTLWSHNFCDFLIVKLRSVKNISRIVTVCKSHLTHASSLKNCKCRFHAWAQACKSPQFTDTLWYLYRKKSCVSNFSENLAHGGPDSAKHLSMCLRALLNQGQNHVVLSPPQCKLFPVVHS